MTAICKEREGWTGTGSKGNCLLAVAVGYLVYEKDRSRARHAKGRGITRCLENTETIKRTTCVTADEFHMSPQSLAGTGTLRSAI